MPTTYAHNLFGKAVFQNLPPELKDIVQENDMAYRIGLHGPDVLFYYKPYKKNSVSAKGSDAHKEKASTIFLRCKELLARDGDPALLAYTLGFICHFMLDSTCHPFIGSYMKKTGAHHDELETEFDRVLMEKMGLNPFHYRPGNFIRPERHVVRVMGEVFPSVTEKEIVHALRGMRFYTGLMVRPTALGRKGLVMIMKALKLDSVEGHVMKSKRSQRCEEGTVKLSQLFHLAVPEAVTVIEDFCRTLGDPKYICCRFERNFE